MVKTDWNNLHGHYPAVARRFVQALGDSSVQLAVSLTSMGSEVDGATGHFRNFFQLEQALNTLEDITLVHLRAGWFMENALAWTGAVADYGRIGWNLRPDVKLSWVATADIAELAAQELLRPTTERRVIREVGSEDLTMQEFCTLIGKAIGRPVEYLFVDNSRKDVEAEYLARFGTPDRWQDQCETAQALNNRSVRFHGGREPLPTTMDAFIREVWKDRYLKAAAGTKEPETFQVWCAKGVDGSLTNDRVTAQASPRYPINLTHAASRGYALARNEEEHQTLSNAGYEPKFEPSKR
jgi:hypothetical protein